MQKPFIDCRFRQPTLLFLFVLFSVMSSRAATAQALTDIEVRSVSWPDGRVVPGPPTTMNAVQVLARQPPQMCIEFPPTPAHLNGRTIDLPFVLFEPCFIGVLPPGWVHSFTQHLPAGSYTARRILITTSGQRVVYDSLEFEVVEAGPPVGIPALSPIALATLCVVLGVVGITAQRFV